MAAKLTDAFFEHLLAELDDAMEHLDGARAALRDTRNTLRDQMTEGGGER